jgi:hypothetical protein
MSVLGCCETGVLAGDQLELDELAMFDVPLNQSVATCSLLAGRVGVQVVGAGEDLGGDTG